MPKKFHRSALALTLTAVLLAPGASVRADYTDCVASYGSNGNCKRQQELCKAEGKTDSACAQVLAACERDVRQVCEQRDKAEQQIKKEDAERKKRKDEAFVKKEK